MIPPRGFLCMKKLFILLVIAAASLSAARVDLSTAGRIVRVSDPQISPDGKAVAVVVTRSNFAENRNDADIVLVDIATKSQRVLTFGRRGVASPRWSPDGSRLAFLAQVETRAQVHAIAMAGGDAETITKSPTGVQSYSWRPDGKALAFAA